MEIKKNIQTNHIAIKFILEEGGKRIGSAYVYLIRNDLHPAPYGLLENVCIEAEYRGQGYGSQLVRAIVAEAKARGCYKLIGTSRSAKEDVHAFYEQLGFKKYGVEFRIDFGGDS